MARFNAGDLVTHKDERQEQIVAYSVYGEIYRVIKPLGHGSLQIDCKGKKTNKGIREQFNSNVSHWMLATKCGDCVHECKMLKKCPLYEE